MLPGAVLITQILNDEPRILIVAGDIRGGGTLHGDTLAIEQHRDLTQGVVLHLVGFIEGRHEGKSSRRAGDDEDRKREGERQPNLDRIAQTPFETIHPIPRTFLMASLPNLRRRA